MDGFIGCLVSIYWWRRHFPCWPDALRRHVSRQPADPPLVMEEFFAGVSDDDGVFVNSGPDGAAVPGRDSGFLGRQDLTLVEDFDYADGERVAERGDCRPRARHFTGTHEDVFGHARVWTKTGACAWNTPWSSVVGPSILPTSWRCVLTGPAQPGNVARWGSVGSVELMLRSRRAETRPVASSSIERHRALSLFVHDSDREFMWSANGTLEPWRWEQGVASSAVVD